MSAASLSPVLLHYLFVMEQTVRSSVNVEPSAFEFCQQSSTDNPTDKMSKNIKVYGRMKMNRTHPLPKHSSSN